MIFKNLLNIKLTSGKVNDVGQFRGNSHSFFDKK